MIVRLNCRCVTGRRQDGWRVLIQRVRAISPYGRGPRGFIAWPLALLICVIAFHVLSVIKPQYAEGGWLPKSIRNKRVWISVAVMIQQKWVVCFGVLGNMSEYLTHPQR